MNPATDVAKRDLPAALRHRFTEFYVDELTDREDLARIVAQVDHSFSKILLEKEK